MRYQRFGLIISLSFLFMAFAVLPGESAAKAPQHDCTK